MERWHVRSVNASVIMVRSSNLNGWLSGVGDGSLVCPAKWWESNGAFYNCRIRVGNSAVIAEWNVRVDYVADQEVGTHNVSGLIDVDCLTIFVLNVIELVVDLWQLILSELLADFALVVALVIFGANQLLHNFLLALIRLFFLWNIRYTPITLLTFFWGLIHVLRKRFSHEKG